MATNKSDWGIPTNSSSSSNSSYYGSDTISPNAVTTPFGDGAGSEPFDPSLIDPNDPSSFLAFIKGLFGADGDTQRTWAQLYLQYILGEQNYNRNLANANLNYDRSKAANQVALMMQAGMSRSAALAALQGGSTPQNVNSDTSITPMQTNAEANQRAKFQNILNAIQVGTQLCNQIISLASAPFDISAKYITNRLLNNQANMLDMQVQGMQDAAMFMQAVSNADTSLPDDRKLMDMSVSDQYQFFAEQAQMKPTQQGFIASAHMYGNGEYFRRAASNPFFWASVNDTVKNRNFANASIFEPQRAEQAVAQIRAGINYTNSLKDVEDVRKRIFSVQAFHDEMLAQLRVDIDKMKANCEKLGIQFDTKRAQKFYDLADKFNLETALTLDGNIERLNYLHTAEVYKATQAELLASSEYQVGLYVYGAALNSLKNGALSEMYQVGNDGVTIYPNNDLEKWIKNYLHYTELGGATALNAQLQIPRTIFSGITTAGVLSFGAAKLFKGANAAKAAASAAGGSSISSTLALPPLVVPGTTPLILERGLFGEPTLGGLGNLMQ